MLKLFAHKKKKKTAVVYSVMPTQPPTTPPEPLLVATASSPVLHMPKPKHAVPPTRAVLNYENDKTEIEPIRLVEDTDEEEKVSPMNLSQEDDMSRVRFAHPPAPKRHPDQQQRRSIGTAGSEDSNRVYESALESPLEDLQDEISLGTPNPQPVPSQMQQPPQQHQLEPSTVLPPPVQHSIPQQAHQQQPISQPAAQPAAAGKSRRIQAGRMMEDLQLKSERLEEFTNVKELQRQVQMIQQQREHERAEWHMREQAHRMREKEMMEKISETQAQLFHALAQAQSGLPKQHPQQHEQEQEHVVYPTGANSYRHDSGYLEDDEVEPDEYTRRSASRGSSGAAQPRRPRPRPSRSMEYAHTCRPPPIEYYEDPQPRSYSRSRHYLPSEEEYAPVRPRSSSSSARLYAVPPEEEVDDAEPAEDAYYYYYDKRRSRSSNSSRRAPTLETEDDGEEDLTDEEDYEDLYMPPMAYHPRRPRSNSASARRYEEDPYYMAPPPPPPEEYYGRRSRRLVPNDSASRRRVPGERQHQQAMAMAAARRGMPPYMMYPPNYYPYS